MNKVSKRIRVIGTAILLVTGTILEMWVLVGYSRQTTSAEFFYSEVGIAGVACLVCGFLLFCGCFQKPDDTEDGGD